MFLVLNKKLLWTIVIWFAVLQMLSPLIHAHVEVDAPSQGHGLHLHMDGMASLLDSQGQDKTPAFNDIAASLHTIGVDKALVKKIESLPAPLFIVLFVICLLVIAAQLAKLKPGFRFSLPLSYYLRPQSRPRAPPLF
jgi:hypothetical protein